jgi:ferritin-like metal-binding protein YciE
MENEYEGQELLRRFLVNHLNRIYCTKSHLVERVSEIGSHPLFSDIKLPMTKLLHGAEKDIIRIEAIYKVLNISSSIENCEEIIATLEDAFTPILRESSNVVLRDMTFHYYIDLVENLQLASLNTLILIAAKLEDRSLNLLIKKSFKDNKPAAYYFRRSRAKKLTITN